MSTVSADSVSMAFPLPSPCVHRTFEVEERLEPFSVGCETVLPCAASHFNHWQEQRPDKKLTNDKTAQKYLRKEIKRNRKNDLFIGDKTDEVFQLFASSAMHSEHTLAASGQLVQVQRNIVLGITTNDHHSTLQRHNQPINVNVNLQGRIQKFAKGGAGVSSFLPLPFSLIFLPPLSL